MDWNILTQFIDTRLLVIAVVLYALGAFLKLYNGFKNNWSIPYILLAISIVLTILYMVFVVDMSFTIETVIGGVIQGILLAALAVFAHQLYSQVKNK